MEKEQNKKLDLIGVHTLSEFVFCPRAGIISHEQGNEDSGFESGFVDLSYTPDYDIVMARLELKEVVKRLESFSFGFLGGTVATLFCGMALKPFLGVLCLLVLIPATAFFSPKLYKDLLRYWHLKKRIADADAANSQCPKLNEATHESISWYSLLKSCSIEKCHDPLIDEELGIIGKPWKLLHRGNVCLPVFFCKKPDSAGDSETDPLKWLKKQHFVRMKAYCHLIEKNTGKHSSCGIIVFAGTPIAAALKFWRSERATRELDEALMIARESLKELDQEDSIGVPAKNACIRCHHGRPKLYRLTPGMARRNGRDVRPTLHKVTRNKKSLTLHSVCGDFFRWIPPHEEFIELKLAPMGNQPAEAKANG